MTNGQQRSTLSLLRFVWRRVLRSALVLIGASIGVFVLLRVVPGDPARLILTDLASEAEIEALRQTLGLDRPLPVQYWIFLTDAIQGDFGTSYIYRTSAIHVVLERLPGTIKLAVAAIGLAFTVAIPLGVWVAHRRGSKVDHIGSFAALLGQSTPNFWTGAMLVLVFSLHFQWFPTSGADSLRSYVLPTISLGLVQIAVLYRVMRSSTLDVLSEEYVWTARAKGLGNARLLVHHVGRNAIAPVLTIAGLQFGHLLGGAVIIESLFAWPGIGKLAVDAIIFRDYPVVQAVLLVSALLFIAINLLVDLAYGFIDPRIRHA